MAEILHCFYSCYHTQWQIFLLLEIIINCPSYDTVAKDVLELVTLVASSRWQHPLWLRRMYSPSHQCRWKCCLLPPLHRPCWRLLRGCLSKGSTPPHCRRTRWQRAAQSPRSSSQSSPPSPSLEGISPPPVSQTATWTLPTGSTGEKAENYWGGMAIWGSSRSCWLRPNYVLKWTVSQVRQM